MRPWWSGVLGLACLVGSTLPVHAADFLGGDDRQLCQYFPSRSSTQVPATVQCIQYPRTTPDTTITVPVVQIPEEDTPDQQAFVAGKDLRLLRVIDNVAVFRPQEEIDAILAQDRAEADHRDALRDEAAANTLCSAPSLADITAQVQVLGDNGINEDAETDVLIDGLSGATTLEEVITQVQAALTHLRSAATQSRTITLGLLDAAGRCLHVLSRGGLP